MNTKISSIEVAPVSPPWRWAIVVLWLGFILYFTLSDPASFVPERDWLGPLLSSLGLPPGTPDAAFHFGGYLVLSVLVAGAAAGRYGRRPLGRRLLGYALAILLFACLQEALQGLTPSRHPDLFDLGTNGVGAVVGLALLRGK